MALITEQEFAQVVRLAPLVAVDLVLRDSEGFTLVGLRNNRPAQGYYFVPGGVIRKGETVAQAFVRVLLVETGLSIPFAQARLLGAYDHIYPDNRFGDPRYGTQYVTLGHELRLPSRPQVRLDDQHNDFRWMTPAELLSSPDVHENTKVYLREPRQTP